MQRILITGGRAPVALDLARSFAAAGATVFVADSAPCFLTRASRAVTKAFRVPPPRQAPLAFAQALDDIVRRERIDCIVPTCEEVFYLARLKERFVGRAELFCPEFSLLAELHSKWRFMQAAQGLDVGVPETWLLRTRDDLTSLPISPDECVFKPEFSRFAVHTRVKPSAAELNEMAWEKGRAWVAQRFVAGRELCSYSVARGGRLTAHAVYEPTWRAGRGSGYYFQPVINVTIERFVANFAAKFGYTGQVGFDFIETTEGRVHVIECNPRATSGVHLFAGEKKLAEAFGQLKGEPLRPRSGKPAMLAAAMALFGPRDALKRDCLGRLTVDWSAARDVLWSDSDPWPAFYLYAGLGATWLKARREGVSLQAASTRDIEWDGEDLP